MDLVALATVADMRLPTVMLIATLFFVSLALAHHSLEAEYDPTRTMTLRGAVTKIDWSNPHVTLFLDVKSADDTGNWKVEMGSPNAQLLEGWKIDTFRVGDLVTVTVYRARDGSKYGFAKKITKGIH